MTGFLIWKNLSELVEIAANSNWRHYLYFRITFVFSRSVCLIVFSFSLSQHWLEPNKAVVRQMKCKCHFCSLCIPLCYFASVCLKRVCLDIYLCVCLLMPCSPACVCLLGAASVWGGQTLQETNYSTPQGLIRTNSTSSWQHTHTHTHSSVKSLGHICFYLKVSGPFSPDISSVHIAHISICPAVTQPYKCRTMTSSPQGDKTETQ